VRAGAPENPDDVALDAISIDSYLISSRSSTILIKVKGESMIGKGICDGDIVVVDKQVDARKGDLVVASVDGEFTLKELDYERGRPVLRAWNSEYRDIRPRQELKLVGVVIGQFRKYGRGEPK
jgi:SOS-response transcriptional repressor LexA